MKLKLRDYQTEALDRTLAAIEQGTRRQLGVAATGLGKAQPVDEPVLTPAGWVQIGDLAVGDSVIGSDGKATKVVGVYPQGQRPVVRVNFSDGASVRCDTDHLWAVRDKHDVFRNRPWRTIQAKDLGDRKWRVPLVDPVQMNSDPLPLDPYLLGILLGDGGLSIKGRVLLHTEHELAASLDLPDPCTLKLLRHDGKAGTFIIGGPTGRGRNPVLSAIRELGLEGTRSGTKRIPESFMFANAPERLDLLRGIMDADGHVRKDRHVEITLANEGLIDDTASLVRSLGGTARKHTKATSWTYLGKKHHGIAWRLSIALDVCPFRWKADRWTHRVKYHPVRQIDSVVTEGSAECVCIAVDAADHLYVTTDYVLTHNTVMFCSLAERMGGRTLILAHRDELVQQAAAKLVEVWPTAEVGVVKASRDEVDAQVVVASVQTLSRPARIDRLLMSAQLFGPFNLIVVDEAHHATADTYQSILKALDAGKTDGPVLLGVTATPDRGDGKGLDCTFDEITWSYDLLWGIRSGYLSDVRGLSVQLAGLDMSRVKIARGDYAAGESGRAMQAADAAGVIVKAWTEHAYDRRTLVFTPTVAVAEEVAEEFQRSGIKAGWVSGETPLDDRRRILQEYSDGTLQVLANCAVLTEGYDEPRTDCVIVARPTKSRSLYAQMIGRGTRRHPDKLDCLVLDVVGASDEHSLVTVPSLFGVDKAFRKQLTDGTVTATELLDKQEQHYIKVGAIKAEEIEMFAEVRRGNIAWVPVHLPGQQRRYERSLGPRKETVVLVERDEGWVAGIIDVDGRKRVLQANCALELAQGIAEDFVRKWGSAALVEADAPWRKSPPSPRQLTMCRSMGIRLEPGATRGDVSEAIERQRTLNVARNRDRKPKLRR